MTSYEIPNMPAGREIDFLVEELVLGGKKEHPKLSYQEWTTEDGQDGGSGFYCPRCGASEIEYNKPCAKHYSTDIAAAWELVEKMKMVIIPTEEPGGWICRHDQSFDRIYQWYERPVIEWAYAETAPLAICRAALLAVMENE